MASRDVFAVEDDGIAIAEDTRRAARAVAQPALNPPKCNLGYFVGDEKNARGALPPSAAKSSLTRDAQRRARRDQQARRGTGEAEFLAAIRAG